MEETFHIFYLSFTEGIPLSRIDKNPALGWVMSGREHPTNLNKWWHSSPNTYEHIRHHVNELAFHLVP